MALAECEAVVSESAQAFLEEQTLAGVRAAKLAFASDEELGKLEKYHGPKARWVLGAWLDTWLNAAPDWNIAACLPRAHCPVLALHGDTDPYGTPSSSVSTREARRTR